MILFNIHPEELNTPSHDLECCRSLPLAFFKMNLIINICFKIRWMGFINSSFRLKNSFQNSQTTLPSKPLVIRMSNS